MERDRNSRALGRLGALVLMCAALGGLPVAAASGVAGNPDTGFGTGGVEYLASSGATPLPIAVQSSGKVVMAGSDSGEWRFTRLNSDGSLDASFGSSGETLLFGDNGSDNLRDMIVDASDRILATGRVRVAITTGRGKKQSTSYVNRLTVVRLTSAGALDTSFGDGGIVHTEVSEAQDGSAQGESAAVQSNGQIVVAGRADGVAASSGGGGGKGKKGGGGSSSTSTAICVLRYDATGDLDTTFDEDGIAVNDASTGDDRPFLGAIGIQSSGKIVVGGRINGDQWALTRYDTDGSVDTTFGQVVEAGLYLRGISIDSSDRIVACGWRLDSNGDAEAIAGRHLAGGSLDTAFGTSGIAALGVESPSEGSAVTHQADGKVVVAADVGLTTTDNDLRPVRLNADGSLDAGFGLGGEGEALGASGADHISLWSVSIDGNGDILLSGFRDDGGVYDWFAARWCGG